MSSARQKGLDEAVGEYTIHADPDDWVEPMMLEELYKKAKEDDADMVICDFICEYKTGGGNLCSETFRKYSQRYFTAVVISAIAWQLLEQARQTNLL